MFSERGCGGGNGSESQSQSESQSESGSDSSSSGGSEITHPHYSHLFIYTSSMFFFYTQLKALLEYIFSISSDSVIFKKELGRDNTTPQLLSSFTTSSHSTHKIVLIKRVFKLKHSNSKFFIFIDKLCMVMGLDSPLLIPQNVVEKLANHRGDLSKVDENILMHETLANLYAYHPNKYSMVPLPNHNNNNNNNHNNNHSQLESHPNPTEASNLLPTDSYSQSNQSNQPIIISKLDKTICDLQGSLYNRDMDLE